MSVTQGSSEAAEDSGSDVFEIVLPITVLVLSDDDFLPDDSEEQVESVWKSEEEDELEVNLNSIILLQSNGTASNDSNSVNIWEESKTASNEDNSITYTEEKQVAKSVCNECKLYLTDKGDADMDECQNYVLHTSSCKTQLTERNEASCREECDGDDSSQKIPPVFSAGIEVRYDTIKTNSQVTLTAIPEHEEEPVSAANGSSQEKQPEIPKEIQTVVEMKNPDSSENGDNEANNSKRSKFEDETLGSHLKRGLIEEPKFTYNCSAPFVNGCSSTSEELLQEVGKLEISASTSAESNTPGEHLYETLSPFPKKRGRQQKVSSLHASPKESQNQQEGLVCLNNIITIKPIPKASSSTDKHERLNFKCRFCSSVYKCSAHLKKHLCSAHKGKKMYKCCYCKRTFSFSVNLQNHLKLHKKITRLKNATKYRKNVRKVGQRRSEERQSKTKKKESKYNKLFSKIERDFTPLSGPLSFSCRICFFASSNPRGFINHMKGHKERPPYQCPQCDYSCISLSYLLNHIYWHAGYKLYQCRFCTFFSLYFARMVRHSYIHTGARPYSCQFCQSNFTSPTALKRHRRLHAGKETCQGEQVDSATRRKRTQRPVKSYTCDECNMVFYTKGHLSFHQEFHEQFKVNGYTNQNNEYHKRKMCKADTGSQETLSLSLPDGEENDCLDGRMLASAAGSKQEDDVRDNKQMRSRKKFSENSHGSSNLRIGNRSEVPLNSHRMEAVICKGQPLFNSKASHTQVQDDDAYHKYVENLKVTWPSRLSAFKTFRCQHCRYATTVHSNFRLHLKLHTNERQFVCEECSKVFKTADDLQKHSLIHLKNGYEFGRCFYVDSCSEDLEWHRDMPGGMCPERDFGSLEGSESVYSLLGSDVFRLQPDAQGDKGNDLLGQSQMKYYQCAECEYATYTLNNLKLHVRTHTGERPYSCSVCQKKFRTSSHLNRHRVLHYNSDYLKCRKCDYSTNKWLSLKQHLATHFSGESSCTGCLYEQKQLPVKTYTCKECGYCTLRNGNLNLHMRIHTGEKPYKCSQCAITFRTSSHLKRHLVTHLKLRCRRCKFSTFDKCAFQKHVKAHKIKSKCAKCNVMLHTKRLLEQHKRQHELEI